jgi:type II secretory pathway predicted ATPase ExeA
MYRQFYNLRLNPFNIEPDPEFLWLGEKHRKGLAALQYGILENMGFILLTGDVGTGKTVLLHQLRKTLPAQVKVAVIQDPGIDVLDLYRILSEDFEITGRFEGKAIFLIQFKRFLIDAYAAQQQVLIIIDEAHRLSCELLDEIRVLSNIDYDNRMHINVFFVGQGEFNRMLIDPRNQAVRQQIAVSYHLSPLDEQETQAYIRHRLTVAGSEKDLFTSEALREIYRLTGGTPRLINVVCERSLVTGYVNELKRIGVETIRECANEFDVSLGIPGPANSRGSKAFNHARVPEIIRSQLSALRSKEKALSARLSVFCSRTLQPKRLWQSLLEHSVALREHFGGVAFRLQRIIGVGRAYGTVINKIRLNLANPAEDGGTDKLRRRSPLWTAAALVGVLGCLFYLSHLRRSLDNSTTVETHDAFYKNPPEIVLSSLTSVSQVQKFYLLFNSGSAELEDESFKVMMQVSQLLSTHPKSRITLTLFFDPTAIPGYTSKLLALRLEGIKSFLAGQGVEADLRVFGRSVESLPEIKKPLGPRSLGSWSEIRIETGK